jgi:hypothetical protein
VRDFQREPKDLHVVDVEPGTERATSFCGLAVEVMDSDWRRGMGGCEACRAEAERVAGQ